MADEKIYATEPAWHGLGPMPELPTGNYIPSHEDIMKTLDELLEDIDVMAPGQWENELSQSIIGDWWAVVTNEGIIAYFGSEADALRFRLDYINTILNPVRYEEHGI